MFQRLQQANPDGGGAAPAAAVVAPAAAAPVAQAAANAVWFPDSHKAIVESKQWKTPADAIDSYSNLEKLIGADRAGRTVVLPKDDKDAEGIKAYHAKIGVPETADKYELPRPEGDNGEFSKIASEWMHKAGVPKAAAQSVAKAWNEYLGAAVKAEQDAAIAASEADLTKLKGEWGGDFAKNSEYAKRFLREIGWDEAKIGTYESTFGTASMLKDFHAFGAKFQESSFAGGGGSTSFSASKVEAQSKLDEIRNARASGTITDAQWKSGKQQEYERLAGIVAGA